MEAGEKHGVSSNLWEVTGAWYYMYDPDATPDAHGPLYIYIYIYMEGSDQNPLEGSAVEPAGAPIEV